MKINDIEITESRVVSARNTKLYNLIDNIVSLVNDEEDYDLIMVNPDNFDVNLECISKIEELNDEPGIDLTEFINFLYGLNERGFDYINIYKED